MIDLLHISLFEKIINYLDDYRDIHSLKISNKNIYNTIKTIHDNKIDILFYKLNKLHTLHKTVDNIVDNTVDNIVDNTVDNTINIQYIKYTLNFIENKNEIYKKFQSNKFTLIINSKYDSEYDITHYIINIKSCYSLFNEHFFIPIVLYRQDCIEYINKSISRSYIIDVI